MDFGISAKLLSCGFILPLRRNVIKSLVFNIFYFNKGTVKNKIRSNRFMSREKFDLNFLLIFYIYIFNEKPFILPKEYLYIFTFLLQWP